MYISHYIGLTFNFHFCAISLHRTVHYNNA